MRFIVNWTVGPVRKNIAIINAGLDAFFEANGYAHDDALRLQACVDGVFNYCVGNITSMGMRDRIEIQLHQGAQELKLVLRHTGPGGEWDDALKPDAEHAIRRTCFDSMGLYIADEMLQDLVFKSSYDIAGGVAYKEYELLYRMRHNRQ